MRLVHSWVPRGAGAHGVPWDGRDDAGTLVAPGTYAVRVSATDLEGAPVNNATGWMRVLA